MDKDLQPGAGTDFVGPLERMVHVEELRPPICSLDCGTMNFGEGIFANTPAHLRVMAQRIQQLGVKPELEVFELGHVRLARELIRLGLIDAPPMFQVCLGIPWGAPADSRSMQAMVDAVPITPQVPAVVASRPSIWPIRSRTASSVAARASAK